MKLSAHRLLAGLLCLTSLLGPLALAQGNAPAAAPAAAASAPAAAPVRLRGVIERIDATTLVLRERNGQVITLVLPPNTPYQEVYPIPLDRITAGAFIGTAALPRADGTLQALEVLVFPEAARGSNEGHYPWDLQPESSMTNATVADLVRGADGRRLTLRYKTGEKTVVVPEDVPIVTFRPGEPSLLKAGAKALVVAVLRDGQPTVLRMTVGRDGFAPPM
jgi:hypothetical protein